MKLTLEEMASILESAGWKVHPTPRTNFTWYISPSGKFYQMETAVKTKELSDVMESTIRRYGFINSHEREIAKWGINKYFNMSYQRGKYLSLEQAYLVCLDKLKEDMMISAIEKYEKSLRTKISQLREGSYVKLKDRGETK